MRHLRTNPCQDVGSNRHLVRLGPLCSFICLVLPGPACPHLILQLYLAMAGWAPGGPKLHKLQAENPGDSGRYPGDIREISEAPSTHPPNPGDSGRYFCYIREISEAPSTHAPNPWFLGSRVVGGFKSSPSDRWGQGVWEVKSSPSDRPRR